MTPAVVRGDIWTSAAWEKREGLEGTNDTSSASSASLPGELISFLDLQSVGVIPRSGFNSKYCSRITFFGVVSRAATLSVRVSGVAALDANLLNRLGCGGGWAHGISYICDHRYEEALIPDSLKTCEGFDISGVEVFTGQCSGCERVNPYSGRFCY